MSLSPESRSKLQKFVRDHKVVFETQPVHSMSKGNRLEVGINIVLYGTHDNPAPTAPIPGCEECVAVWEHLRAIAAAALPPDDRDSVTRVEDYRPGLSYDSKRQPGGSRARADVELIMTIRHRDEYNRDVDPCELRCAKEVVAALRSLGVPEGTWSGLARDDHV